MRTQIKRLGSGLGVSIPKHVAEAMGLKNGQEVRMRFDAQYIVITRVEETVVVDAAKVQDAQP